MSNIEEVVVKNITVKVSNLKKAFEGRYGSQYGAVLSGEGLESLGLNPTKEGDGYWYNTNATYGNTGRVIPPAQIVDTDGNEIEDELGAGTVIHGLFQKRHYEAGVRKDGTPFPAGFNVVLVGAIATEIKVKADPISRLQSLLLESSMEAEAKAEANPFF
jgi:hypothetical protein